MIVILMQRNKVLGQIHGQSSKTTPKRENSLQKYKFILERIFKSFLLQTLKWLFIALWGDMKTTNEILINLN